MNGLCRARPVMGQACRDEIDLILANLHYFERPIAEFFDSTYVGVFRAYCGMRGWYQSAWAWRRRGRVRYRGGGNLGAIEARKVEDRELLESFARGSIAAVSASEVLLDLVLSRTYEDPVRREQAWRELATVRASLEGPEPSRAASFAAAGATLAMADSIYATAVNMSTAPGSPHADSIDRRATRAAQRQALALKSLDIIRRLEQGLPPVPGKDEVP